MGIRIEAYAVDLPRLDELLNRNLADLLVQYHRDGIDEETQLSFTIGNRPDLYGVTPRGRIRACVGELPNQTVTEDQLHAIEALQRTAREHISTDDIYQARWLLRGFSNCRGIDFIKQLTGGYRRWWIGSVLQSAQPLLSSDDHKALEQLFRKILRGSNCGLTIADGDPGYVADGLPFVPDNDPDLKFGRWSETDCSDAVLLLSKIMASSPTFRRPPEFAMSDMTDSEWHEWAHRNVLSFLQMQDLNFRVCNVLSFIG